MEVLRKIKTRYKGVEFEVVKRKGAKTYGVRSIKDGKVDDYLGGFYDVKEAEQFAKNLRKSYEAGRRSRKKHRKRR